jgi:hypothetical protein
MVGHLLLLTALAAPPSSATARAEALNRRAMLEFDGGDLDEALVDAKKAYAIQPVPGMLFNLGQIHRALHHWEEAAFAFRAFLRKVPDAPNRATIEKLIAEMDGFQRARLEPAPAAPAPTPLEAPAIATPPAAPHPAPAAAPSATKLVVLDIQARFGVGPELATALTDAVVLEVRRHKARQSVVGADEVRAMIGLEKQKALLGCTDTACLAEIGGAMGAREVLMGTLARFGNAYLLTLRLVDTRAGTVSAEASARVASGSDEALLDEVAKAVAQLFPAPVPAPAAAVTEPPAGAASASVQKEARGHTLAWTLLGVGLAAGVVAIVGIGEVVDFDSKSSTYQATPTFPNYQTASAAAGRANLWGPVAIACGAGAALLGAGTAIAW